MLYSPISSDYSEAKNFLFDFLFFLFDLLFVPHLDSRMNILVLSM